LIPRDGKLVVLPPITEQGTEDASAVRAAISEAAQSKRTGAGKSAAR
jgi:hypothetical protein